MLLLGLLLSLVSLIPLPKDMLLGNGDEPVFAPIAFFMWLFAVGLICASHYILSAITSVAQKVQGLLRMQGFG